jgi:hypothetical protein
VHWYLAHGVSWQQLLHWGQCSASWTNFQSGGPLTEHPDLKELLRGNACNIFTVAKAKPQSLSLSVLVVMEVSHSYQIVATSYDARYCNYATCAVIATVVC